MSTELPAFIGRRASDCRETFSLSSGWRIKVYRNVGLAGSAAVTHALVVIHGGGRNPFGTFNSMMTAAALAGVTEHTLVLAPRFKTERDHPSAYQAVWTDQGWKQGDDAVRPAGLSSFAVADELLTCLADGTRFPNLRAITLAGHSAGGQFVQRYAAFGRAPSLLPRVSIEYVVANPSSFLYFDPARPTRDGTRFAVPGRWACFRYDHYKYGMQGRTGYPAALTSAHALSNYLARRVTILNGDADTYQNGGMADSCAAMLEGPNRRDRGAYFFRRIQSLYPEAPHTRIVIPKVHHDHYAMFTSALARPVLFGAAGS